MIRVRYGIVLALAFAALLNAGLASAQDQGEEKKDPYAGYPSFVDDSRRIEISSSFILQGTGMNLITIEGGEDAVSALDQQRGSIEVNIAYFFDRYKSFGLEALVGYTWGLGSTQLPGSNADPDNPVIFPINPLDHSVITYGGNIIYQFGYLDIVPFVTFGAAADHFRPRGEESEFPVDDTFWHIGLGLGFKYFFKEWVGVRVSVDDYFYFLDDVNIATGNVNQFRFKIGGVFTF